MELLDLNDDCLIHLCRFFDAESIVACSETCSTLKSISEKLFKYKKSLTCCIETTENEVMVAKALQKLGKNFTKITLMFDHGYQDANKLFALITQSIGCNLTELSILGEICSMPLKKLAPTLKQLTTLSLQNTCWHEGCVSEINLPSLCRNLRALTVRGQINFAPRWEKAFRHLEHLDVEFASKPSPACFFRQNRQLRRLNLSYRREICVIKLTEISSLFDNLEELHLDLKLLEDPTKELPELVNFHNLRSLALYKIPAGIIPDIFKVLETLIRLNEVVLQSEVTRLDAQYSTIQQSIVGLAIKLKELKSLVTVNIDWTMETVVEFVSEAENLIYLDFWSGSDSNYVVTPTFIRKLAAKRKLSTIQPLNLKMYAMDYELKQVNNTTLVCDVCNRFNCLGFLFFSR